MRVNASMCVCVCVGRVWGGCGEGGERGGEAGR